jgi:hypothetical protein
MKKWIQKGFDDFSKGLFVNGGDNLYVNADGVIEMIHRFDLNNDGNVDIVISNTHGEVTSIPSYLYTQRSDDQWDQSEIPVGGGWTPFIADIDNDGYPDLLILHAQDGITSNLKSTIIWGGPGGLTAEKTELSTSGAYDAELLDISGNGLTDIFVPSAWEDLHNPGALRNSHVFIQDKPRHFIDRADEYGILSSVGLSVAACDLNKDGETDFVIANLRSGFEYNTDSYVYVGTKDGFVDIEPIRLPTRYAHHVETGDLSGDGYDDIVFSGGGEIRIFWNRNGSFSAKDFTTIQAVGDTSIYGHGHGGMTIADIDLDGKNELLMTSESGTAIYKQESWSTPFLVLPLPYAANVEVADINNNGRPDIIVVRHEDGKVFRTESLVYWNSKDGFTTDNVTAFKTTGAMNCAIGDLNGDGKNELVFSSVIDGYSRHNEKFPCYVYMGDKDYHYGIDTRIELPIGNASSGYVIADTDLDGYPELIISNSRPGEGIRIFPSGPDGPDPSKFSVIPGATGAIVFTADVNRDGWLDLIIVGFVYDDKEESLNNSTKVYFGSSEGYSPDNMQILPSYTKAAAVLADTNKNGYLDFVFFDMRNFIGVYPGGPRGFEVDKLIEYPFDMFEGHRKCVTDVADFTGDGYPDLVLTVMGHYARVPAGFAIAYGGPEGYSPDRCDFKVTGMSPVGVDVTDLNNDGYLDVVVPAYSTKDTRELPAQIYRGTKTGPDLDNPREIMLDSSTACFSVDLNGNGYRDLIMVCHRDNVGHFVNSRIFRNGPNGISDDDFFTLPGMGPHYVSSRDFGNQLDRTPHEYYESVPNFMSGSLSSISWDAEVPQKTDLRFQLRTAAEKEDIDVAPWCGADGPGTFFSKSASSSSLGEFLSSGWIQYRAIFTSINGCLSPKLREVTICFE